MARLLSAVMLVFAVLGAFAVEADPPVDAARAAFADPGNEALVQAYYESLRPDSDGFVVVEGDIILSRAELEDYVRERARVKPRVARYRGELLVDRVDDRDNFYRDMAARKLTYAIIAESFTDDERSEIAAKLRRAGEQWANVCPECGISFTEVADPAVAFFTVRKVRDGRYLAAAFFPAYPRSRRHLNIDESFFSTAISQTGILRHELGHVLGYRHEQIRGIAGCEAEGGLWRPLTAYDPNSVMHYFCGGGGNIKLELSDADRKGHRALYLPPGAAAQFTAPQDPAAAAFESAALAAQRSPADEAARAAFVARLPRLRSGDFYVVEGDIILAGVEIEDYLRAQTPSGPRAPAPNGELLVNQYGGRDDVHPADRRMLRYRVEAASFSTPERYKQVRDNFNRAASDWNTACGDCGLTLEHASKYDQEAQPGSAVFFTVREQDEGGAFVAAAFFPHEPTSRRVVLVDPIYYDDLVDRVGVFRHEIGHILGYRHEHIRGIAGCYSPDENDQWRPVTPYDPKSVMHYFCGGGGSLKLEISENDRLGHRDVYRARTAPGPALGELRIRLLGGEVSANAAHVLQLLEDNELLKKTEYSVGAKENIDDILIAELNLPGVGSSMRGLARKLNKSVDWRNVQIGEKLWIPAVRFKSDPVTYSFDLTDDRDKRRLESIQQNWEAVVQPEAKATSYDPDFVKLTFQSYELQIPVTSEKELARAQRVITAIYGENNANLKAGLVRSGKNETLFPFYSVNPVSRLVNVVDWWGETTGKDEQEAGKEGDLGQLINLLERGTPSCEDLCPEVVLIDNAIFPHPDVRAGVRGLGGGPPDPVTDSKQKFVHADFDKKIDHGTHLAGIIAARRNGFGLVGVDPDALITPLLWSDYIGTRFDDLAKYVLKRNDEPNIYIYVTASSWQYAQLIRSEDRFDNTLAAMIRDVKPLWISAAGNEGKPVRPTTLYAPMNLGDLSTVLVVAACSPCGTDARLLPDSNHADPDAREKIVHLAAPGKSVPSTVDQGRYAETDGTSQAAAFVGGLASLMVRTWPTLYRHPPKLRMRLMTTSRPVQAKEFAGSVAAGVVDAANALRDPRINWITFKAVGKPEEAVEFKWVSDRLETKVAGSVHKPVINTEDIVSMYRFDDGQWALYLKTHPGPVDVFERVGPLTILNAGDVLSVKKDGEEKRYGIAALQQLNRAEMGDLKQ